MTRLRGAVLVGALVVSVAVAAPGVSLSITCVSFSEIQSPAPEILGRLNVKLTYLDYRGRFVPSVVFRAAGAPVDVRAAFACRKLGNDYSADAVEFSTFSVSTAELQAALDSLGTIATVVDAGVDATQFLSVSVIDPADTSSRVFDSVVDGFGARLVFRKLLAALAQKDSALTVLGQAACQLRLSTEPAGADFTQRTSVRLSGIRLRRSDGLYVGRLKVRNTSHSFLPAPAILAVRFEGRVRAVSPTGVTGCSSDPPGSAYYALPIGGGLNSGGEVEVPIQLLNPDRQRVRVSLARVLQVSP